MQNPHCWCGRPIESNPAYDHDTDYRNPRTGRPYAPWIHYDEEADDAHEAIPTPESVYPPVNA